MTTEENDLQLKVDVPPAPHWGPAPDLPETDMTASTSEGLTYALRSDSQIALQMFQKPSDPASAARRRTGFQKFSEPEAGSFGKVKSAPSCRAKSSCDICKQEFAHPKYVDFLADIPKNILPDSEFSSAHDFQPTTQDCLVATNSWDRKTGKSLLPPEVFENLWLTHTPDKDRKGYLTHRLVRDFEYDCENGICLYDKAVSEDETKNFKYAQLVTLNNWYNMLFAHMMRVFLQSLSLSVSVMLMAILSKEEFIRMGPDINKLSLQVFIGLVSGLYAVAIFCARSAALWQWHVLATPIVGDLVNNSHWLDRNATFAAMVFFNFFQIEKLLKDMPIYLHPWKSVQPYAAMKVENSRVHIIGFESKHFFNVVKNSGHQNVLYIMTLNHTVQLLFTIHVLVWHAKTRPTGSSAQGKARHDLGTYIFSCVITSSACFVSWYLCIQQFSARSHMRSELIAMLSSPEASEAKSAAAQKLLALHFHQKWEDPLGEDPLGGPNGQLTNISLKRHVDDGRLIAQKKNKCSKCGRVIPAQDRGSLMGSLISEADSQSGSL